MDFSGFLKTSGTLSSMSLLGVLEVLWGSLDLKNLWYTWENETPRCTRGFMGFSGFLKTSGTLGSMSLLGVLKVLWTSLDF